MTGYPLTLDQLEEGHLLVVGTTGSGKTYQLRGMIEQLRRADRRVGAIDKLGNHWGLTTSADGQAAGLEFVIFGGKRGVVPMTPDQGEMLGRLFVERNIPAIFDVSQWKSEDQQRWVADFADAVFRYNEGALHLTLDEVQSWAPQGGGGEAFRAVQRLAEQGRGNGVRLLMSCQRLSRLDATVRGMAHRVVAMRQTLVLDRKAVQDLIASTKQDVAILDRDIPTMKTGSAFLWSSDAAEMAKVAFPANTTFDSSRTPRHGDTPPAPIAVSSALVDELRKALAPPPVPRSAGEREAAREADAISFGLSAVRRKTDLDVANRRIAELEAENVGLRANVDRFQFVASRALTIADRQNKDIGELLVVLEPVRAANLHSSDANLHSAKSNSPDRRPTAADGEPPESSSAGGSPLQSPPVSAPVTADTEDGSPAKAPAGDPSINLAEPGDRELRALAGLAAVAPLGLTEAAWAARTGYSRKGGAWNRRRKRYVDLGWIEERGGRWHATDVGVHAAGAHVPDMPRPGMALVKWWSTRLGAPGRVLELLAAVHPKQLTRDAIAAELGMSPRGGAFNRHISAIKSADLAHEKGKRLAIAPELVGEN